MVIEGRPTGSTYDWAYAGLCTLLAVNAFFLTNYLLDCLFRSKRWWLTDEFKPCTAKYSDARWHRLLNISVSFIHSTVSGGAAFASFLVYPDMCDDMIGSYNHFTRHLTIFSLGYFIYDCIDNLVRSRATINYFILVHHIVCIIAFTITSVTGTYVAYAAVSLVMELSSVFLHMRVLLKMHDCNKDGALYRVVSLVNIGAFLIFRIMVIGWMTRWLLNNKHLIAPSYYIFGGVGLAVMTGVNVVIFYQLLIADRYLKAYK